MSSIDEFYEDYYVLSYITRYSNVIRIKNESVAEHSFFVALLVLKLADTYNFDIQTALAYAIVHDMMEAEINDITHYTKSKYPEINKAVKDAETQAFNAFPDGWIKSYYEFGKMYPDSNEMLIVKLADVIQCSQYAKHEMKLGNKGYMEDVFCESVKRRRILEEKLSKCRRADIV